MDFEEINVGLTDKIAEFLLKENRSVKFVFSSSIQAENNTHYGKSKLEAENKLKKAFNKSNIELFIFRLTNVFGKWAKPNYNSVVATFCHNLTRDIPIEINDPDKTLNLVYIDDLIKEFEKICFLKYGHGKIYNDVNPVHRVSLRDLKKQLEAFKLPK